MAEANAYPTLHNEANNNLLPPQKQVLLWHQQLSHACVSWIQRLMRDCKWVQDKETNRSLNASPFIFCKNIKAPTFNPTTMKCATCLCAKASVCSPTANPISKQDHNK